MIYARYVNGRFHRLRAGVSLALQGLLFVIPWLEYNGRPLVMLDLPGRKLYLGPLIMFPQETFFLLLLLVLAGLTLFFSTALAGRMWCGYACPQTLFSQSFMTVERWVEGDRARRMRRDKGAWTTSFVVRRVLKLGIWTLMGLWLGITVSGYFHPIREPYWPLVAFFTFVSVLDFGFIREMFCHNWCPYARFQGAMFDRDSLIIAYDDKRGEPRGKLGKTTGSCVDCSLCVQVCPMGIDIRNGLQLECIACAACVDACDQVMDKIHQPRGLVRYSSLSGQQRLTRPRILVYAVLYAAVLGLFGYTAWNRAPMTLDVVRSSALFTTTPDGRIANNYMVHLVNRQDRPVQVTLRVEGLSDAELIVPQGNPVQLAPASVGERQVLVVAPAGGKPVQHFKIMAEEVSCETTFVGPVK